MTHSTYIFTYTYVCIVCCRYPSILWDVLPHAGASQVHPHVHGLLGVHQYSGAFEKLHAISQEYYAKHHRSYWTDLIKVHDALGLVVRFGDAVAMVPLVSSFTYKSRFTKLIIS